MTRLWNIALAVVSALLVAFLALPVLALALTLRWSDFAEGVQNPLLLPALKLSAVTTACSLTLVAGAGTLLAWLIARRRSRATRLLETVAQLPAVVPPAVAGVGLLLAFGRRGLLGAHSLAFTTLAVILAEAFVSAPFFIQAAISAFRRV